MLMLSSGALTCLCASEALPAQSFCVMVQTVQVAQCVEPLQLLLRVTTWSWAKTNSWGRSLLELGVGKKIKSVTSRTCTPQPACKKRQKAAKHQATELC